MLRKYSGVDEDETDSSDEEFAVLDESDPRCKVLYTHPNFQYIFQQAKNSETFVKYETKNDAKEITINDAFEHIKETVELKDEDKQSSGINNLKEVAIGKLAENINDNVEQKCKEKTSEKRKRISGKENLQRESFPKIEREDYKGKDKSSSSAKKIMKRASNWFLGPYYKHSKNIKEIQK